MTAEELPKEIDPAINALGSAFYFVPPTLARGKELGLDGFRWYFLGRGGVLGDVEAPVVTSAFGYFHPDLVARMWDSARKVLSPREAARAYIECSREFGRARFEAIEDLDGFCAAAEAVTNRMDRAALALFAGLAAEALPEDLPARAMQLVTVLRELRGSVHLLSVVASGVSPRAAHAIKRPDDVTGFGWSEADAAVTSDDRRAWERAGELTDRLMAGAYSVLADKQAEALRTGVRRLEEAAAKG